MYVYFYSLHVSGSHVSIIRKINFQYDIWHMSLCVDDRLMCRFAPAHQTVIYIQ